MACNDWVGSLRRASYRGVSFFVETDQIATGRRLVIHEFPNKDVPYVEDLGRKANTISVTAYVHGDNVGSIEGSLRKACDAGGPARLNLPMARAIAHCQECSRSYKKDQLGYIAFDLKFVVEGSRPAPFAALNVARSIEFAAGNIVSAVADALSRDFAGIGVPGIVSDMAIEHLQTFAAEVDVATRSSAVAPEFSGALISAAAMLASNAEAFLQIGDRGDRFTDTSFIATAKSGSATPLAEAVVNLFVVARKGLAGGYADDFLTPWLSYTSAVRPSRLATASARRQEKNAVALDNAIRAAAAAQYVTSVALRDYPSAREARQARADVAEYFETALAGLNGWRQHAVWRELTDMRGRAVEMLSRMTADLAPVIVVSAPRRLPSLWWANRLYGDANRGAEIVARNRVKHAHFMPTEFEALSR